jgi:proteic killer suppression protein
MRIRNVVHKGLRRLIENDDASGIQAVVAEKLRRMISFLQDMEKRVGWVERSDTHQLPLWR